MSERFGCRSCWPDSPEQANLARRTLDQVELFVDELSLQMAILRCPACAQAFVSVLTEVLDAVMPVTDDEVVDVIVKGPSLAQDDLRALAPERRSLAHDHPEGGVAVSSWGKGLGRADK